MASVSRCRTLRSIRVLLRHQMLQAMHVSFGKSAFRPEPPDVLGIGVMWAFTGKAGPLRLYGPSGPIDPTTLPGMAEWMRSANQYSELRFLSGPEDHELEELR